MRCAYCTLRLLTASGRRAGFCPPVVRRGEGVRSGAPSWTTAQTQAVQGCTVCVVPPDLLPEPRAPDAGGRTSGGEDLWCYLPKRAGLSKVTRQAAQRRRNPVEDGVLVSCMAKPCQLGGAIFRHAKTLPTPLTLTLSRKGRGNGYRGRLRFANRPYTLIAPYVSPAWGRGHSPEVGTGTPVEGATLGPRRRGGSPAGLRKSCYRPWLSLPQCAVDHQSEQGGQQAPWLFYGAVSARSMEFH
jgi:hypothetical protein